MNLLEPKSIYINEEEGLRVDWSEGEKEIDLYILYVEPKHRWKGIATRFMKSLCDYADLVGKAIELECGGAEEDGIQDLPAFYWQFGFRWAEGFMRREPKL